MSSHPTQEQERSHLESQTSRIIASRDSLSTRTWSLFLKNLALMTAGGLLFLTAFILAGVWQSSSNLFSKLGTLFSVAQAPAQVDVRSVIVQQVRGASELTTAVYTMESVVPTSQDRTIGGYVIGKTTLLYIAHGEVRAGVDLAALQPNDVQVEGNNILLRLPPPKILDSKIDVNRSKVYDYDRGFLGLGPDVAPELQELAQRETLTKIVETACTNGVLQAANDRAKLVVSQLLNTGGYTQLQVATQMPNAETCVAANASSPSSVSPGSVPSVLLPSPPMSTTPIPATPIPSESIPNPPIQSPGTAVPNGQPAI